MKTKRIKLKKMLDGNFDNDTVNSLYINYIEALVKSESLQNKLENVCKTLIGANGYSISDYIININNSLNKSLVNIMTMQNLINYISMQQVHQGSI